MANVLLTTRCNLQCPYCFAQERLQGNAQVMSLADAEKVAVFLKKSGHLIFRAMGGEPTLHPKFPEIVEMALRQGLRVDVLSNATWPEAYNDFFGRIPPQDLGFLLNVDHPSRYRPVIWQRIESNLAAAAAAGNVTLSFNIFEATPQYDYVLDLIAKHRIDKLRVSLSLPVVGVENSHLRLEDLRGMGAAVVEVVRQAADRGATVHLDNAVPLCMFTHEQAGELLLNGVLDLKRNARCEPVVDIGPDLTVWCCFCLSKLWNRRLEEFANLQEIIEYYRGIMGRYQSKLYPLEECSACRYAGLWNCQGGCLSYTVLKHGDVMADGVGAESPVANWRPDAILALHPEAEVRRYDIPARCCRVSRRNADLQMTLESSWMSVLPLLDGAHRGSEVLDGFLREVEDPEIDGPIAEFARRTMEEGAKGVLLGMLRQGLAVVRPG